MAIQDFSALKNRIQAQLERNKQNVEQLQKQLQDIQNLERAQMSLDIDNSNRKAPRTS